MILYLDTSSLIKLYVEESGSEATRRLMAQASVASTSVVAYPEMRAALARLHRHGTLTPLDHDRIKRALDDDWPRLLTVGVTERLYRHAGDLAEKHALRGFDSLHLASYLAVVAQRGSSQHIRFSSFDNLLNHAADQEAQRM